jgi:hypothetical protein
MYFLQEKQTAYRRICILIIQMTLCSFLKIEFNGKKPRQENLVDLFFNVNY